MIRQRLTRAGHMRGSEPLYAARWFQIAAAGLLVGALAVFAMADLPDFVTAGSQWVVSLMRRYSYVVGFGLLYVEESGIPLPAPGDVYVMYVGAHVPRNLFSWLAAWLGLIAAVLLGATNLYFISRRLGRRVVEGRFANLVHLTPARLARGESWFARYGVLAIIFGRHIPGFRVPITVAAGVLRVSYPVFALSVAASTAIWAGVVLVIGIIFGARVEAFLLAHRAAFWLFAAGVALACAGYTVRRQHVRMHARKVQGARSASPSHD